MALPESFHVPNAPEVVGVSYRLAEPDKGDWQIVGDKRSGVLTGLDSSFASALSIQVETGRYVLSGAIKSHTVSTVGLNAGGGDPRFDLVGFDSTGLTRITGTASSEPVFPDIPADFVVVAAVYVPAGTSDLNDDNHIVDKRVFLTAGARGAVAGSATFLHNNDGTDEFKVLGDGSMEWGDGATITPSTDALTVSDDLTVSNDLTVTGNIAGNTASFTGDITSDNIRRGSGAPSDANGSPGDIYQNTDGVLYVKRGNNQWGEIYADEYPTGTVIANIQDPTTFLASNPTWAHLAQNPTIISNADAGDYAALYAVAPSSWKDQAGANTLTLPAGTDAVLMSASNSSSLAGPKQGSNTKVIAESNLPSHSHFAGNETGAAGAHGHSGSTSAAGAHTHDIASGGGHNHPISDPGHRHNGMNPYELDVPTYFCGAVWGGTNKLDAHFSDASHTWTVDMAASTVIAWTGISIPGNTGSHSHSARSAGSHSHPISVAGVPAHTHSLPSESAVGNDEPFDVRPARIEVNYYIKL